MSVSVRLNPLVVIGCVVAVALVAGFFAYAEGDTSELADAPSTTRIHTPTKALDIVRSSTPARSAVGVSRRLYDSSPVAVLADRHDRRAQKVAIASATTLGVPVLINDATAPVELKRLGARRVLTFGKTLDVEGAQAVSLDPAKAAETVADLRGATAPHSPRRLDAIVVTRSRAANAAAVATARNAGADVLQIRSTDPRRTPAVAKALAARPGTPVIALGTPFVRNFAYTLKVVRSHVVQPTGGYLALPGKHYTAMYGYPGAPSLGVLGEQGAKASIKRVQHLARKYRRVSTAEFVPTFEVIATVASGSAGKDKDYSQEASIKTLTPLIDAAEKAGVYVILDLQPGRTNFLKQAKRYRSLLERPNVGLALDPEWRLKKKQKHLRQIGSVQVAEINRVSDWLAKLTRRNALPQKIFVLHQFSLSMIKHRSRLETRHAELATVIHVDGSGPQGAKQGTWKTLRRTAPAGVFWGWKNFIDEDPHMLTAQETWRRVKPHPSLISYQ
ncbi:hypothetical protein [Aeromicrobium ginsengisoli]|uniref:Cell wall-binding repeat-containing protein n=1 Tax=Aeromicrobium ginsengisoli TaxID=363867 RepID=A0A5M4FBK5_9ACTN|nr:hypothetical protein [Aeromicrobium ginsengisoli]KAA1395675.1 hypothetical protein ESP70_016125 [Aeromicrobium ginsengisoli]